MRETDCSWIAICSAYLLTVLCMATVGAVIPLMADWSARLGVPTADLGFGISLFSAPSAVLSAFAGGAIDRIGPKRILVVAAAIAALGDILIVFSGSLAAFYGAMIVEGLAYGAINIAVPALFIATATGERRTRAMALWSTYAPIGFSSGLLLGAPFAGHANWSLVFVIHGGLLAAATLMSAFVLPSPLVAAGVSPRPSAGAALRGLWEMAREGRVLRLAFAAGLPSAISYGTGLVAPSYWARTHSVSVAMSSTTVACAKMAALLVAGLVMGQLLASKVKPLTMFLILASTGLVAQFTIFYPGGSYALAIAALMLWLFSFGGMSAVAMTLLPTLIPDSRRGAAASGLVAQIMSIVSFLTPTVYFGVSNWVAFVTLAGVGLAVSVAMLPAWTARRAVA
jgi:MFS family permease